MVDPKDTDAHPETPAAAQTQENTENVQAPTQDQLPDPHSPDPIMTHE